MRLRLGTDDNQLGINLVNMLIGTLVGSFDDLDNDQKKAIKDTFLEQEHDLYYRGGGAAKINKARGFLSELAASSDNDTLESLFLIKLLKS